MKSRRSGILLCADARRYDPSFYVHLERELAPPAEGNDQPYVVGDVDVALRAPHYLDALKDGTFREWSGADDLDADDNDEGEPWTSGPDA